VVIFLLLIRLIYVSCFSNSNPSKSNQNNNNQSLVHGTNPEIHNKPQNYSATQYHQKKNGASINRNPMNPDPRNMKLSV
jgi:hypothetical protein